MWGPGVQSTGFSRVVFLDSSKSGKSPATVNILIIRYYYPAKAGTLNTRYSEHSLILIEAHVGKQSFGSEPAPRINHIAIGDDDSAAVPNQLRVRNYPAFANRTEIIHFHLDRCKSSARFRSAHYCECDRGVDQRRDSAAVHYAGKLKMTLLDVETQSRAARLNRIELDAKRFWKVIGLEFFTDTLKCFGSDFHSLSFFRFSLSCCR